MHHCTGRSALPSPNCGPKRDWPNVKQKVQLQGSGTARGAGKHRPQSSNESGAPTCPRARMVRLQQEICALRVQNHELRWQLAQRGGVPPPHPTQPAVSPNAAHAPRPPMPDPLSALLFPNCHNMPPGATHSPSSAVPSAAAVGTGTESAAAPPMPPADAGQTADTPARSASQQSTGPPSVPEAECGDLCIDLIINVDPKSQSQAGDHSPKPLNPPSQPRSAWKLPGSEHSVMRLAAAIECAQASTPGTVSTPSDESRGGAVGTVQTCTGPAEGGVGYVQTAAAVGQPAVQLGQQTCEGPSPSARRWPHCQSDAPWQAVVPDGGDVVEVARAWEPPVPGSTGPGAAGKWGEGEAAVHSCAEAAAEGEGEDEAEGEDGGSPGTPTRTLRSLLMAQQQLRELLQELVENGGRGDADGVHVHVHTHTHTHVHVQSAAPCALPLVGSVYDGTAPVAALDPAERALPQGGNGPEFECGIRNAGSAVAHVREPQATETGDAEPDEFDGSWACPDPSLLEALADAGAEDMEGSWACAWPCDVESDPPDGEDPVDMEDGAGEADEYGSLVQAQMVLRMMLLEAQCEGAGAQCEGASAAVVPAEMDQRCEEGEVTRGGPAGARRSAEAKAEAVVQGGGVLAELQRWAEEAAAATSEAERIELEDFEATLLSCDCQPQGPPDPPTEPGQVPSLLEEQQQLWRDLQCHNALARDAVLARRLQDEETTAWGPEHWDECPATRSRHNAVELGQARGAARHRQKGQDTFDRVLGRVLDRNRVSARPLPALANTVEWV